MQYVGTSLIYLCIRNKTTDAMKNTDYILKSLDNIISSEGSLKDILDMIDDMGLEITGIRIA